MKSLLTFLVWALLTTLPCYVFGQKATPSKANLSKNYTFYKNTDPNLNHLNYFEAMRGNMGLSEASEMVLTETLADQNGLVHYKYQQYHEGVPVFGNRYILHEKDGKVRTANGQFSPKIEASAKPGISAATALGMAKLDMGCRQHDREKSESVLCYIDPAFPRVSEKLVLAYRVDLHSDEPWGKRRYFVDAHSSKIVLELPLIIEEGVPSTAQTKYYGIQNIITDSVGPQDFVLRDLTRGGGIFVNKENGQPFSNSSSQWNLTNDFQDEVALDAHYCTQEYYDLMLEDFDWQGQDGLGKALKVKVHNNGAGNVNAFWDGEYSNYGDGDCVYGPLTTLEVVGHEFTHGMIDYTSKLVYDSESGAINESLADMFGKILERKTDPSHFNWDLGHSFILSPSGTPFRVMDDPKSVQMPAYYQGEFWDDFNDVHANSSIGNLWFTMLVDGKQGVNEVGQSFQIPALGIDKMGQIVFQTNKFYLTENSNYNAFHDYSIEVAETLYGVGSAEALAVKEAWKAVGLPVVLPTSFDLLLASEGFSGALYCDLGGYIPVNVYVINHSTIPYTPSMQGKVTLSAAGQSDYVINLTSPIQPGEIFEVVVDDWLQIDDFGFLFVDMALEVTDDDPTNNFGSNYYSVVEHPADDLSLFVASSIPDCFATTKNTFLVIGNNSCENLPAGTELTIVAADAQGNLVWVYSYTLIQDLTNGANVFWEIDVTTSFGALTYTLLHPNDPNLDNNIAFDDLVGTTLPITGNYLNTFESNDWEDEYLEIDYNSSNPILNLQGTQYFAITGGGSDPSEFQHCANVPDLFNYDYTNGMNGSIRTCVDFSFSPAPVLEFDVRQYRNAPNFEFSSMLQARWEGNENGKFTVVNQPEGALEHHSIALPPFFKGELKVRMYTEIGHWEPNIVNLSQDDFVLFDNLKLSAPTSGTTETDAANALIQVSPNPARQLASIQSAEGIKTILVYHPNGQLLRNISANTSQYALDLQELSNGVYFLNIQLDNGQWGMKKLVKMD